jgi:dipeptidyl aminopeptidase/acylaminoacyl peptidase
MTKNIGYFLLIILLSCSKGSGDEAPIPPNNPPPNNPPPGSAVNKVLYVHPNPDGGIYSEKENGENDVKLLSMTGVDSLDYANWASNLRIYFTGKFEGDSHLQIYSMKSDGTDLKIISISDDVEHSQLHVSQDRLLYKKTFTDGSKPPGIYRSKSDGSEEMKIMDIEGIHVSSFSWVPWQDKIVYVSVEPLSPGGDPVSNIYLISSDGTGKSMLTNNENPLKRYDHVYFCPDGSRITFVASNDTTVNGYSAYVADKYANGGYVILTSSSKSTSYVTGNWSSDIAWILVTDNNGKLYAVAADGSSKVPMNSVSAVHPKFKDF